jgi:hypothetical protein
MCPAPRRPTHKAAYVIPTSLPDIKTLVGVSLFWGALPNVRESEREYLSPPTGNAAPTWSAQPWPRGSL